MVKIEKTDESILYENPNPTARSKQAIFPGLTKLPSGELIALFVIGEAFEAANCRTYISRSSDNGKSWKLQGELYDQKKLNLKHQISDAYKPTLLKNGTLIATGYGQIRTDPEKGIGDSESNTFPPGMNAVLFSSDNGHTWTDPHYIRDTDQEMIELSGPCIQLASGKLIAAGPPFNLNPSQQKGLVLESSDNGKSWQETGTYFKSPKNNIGPWETRLCQMQPDRVVAMIWAYDLAAQKNLENHVSVSHDGGKNWSEPINTGHTGQASNIMWLGEDKLLTIHAHREGDTGLYIRLVDFSDDQWNLEYEECIWGNVASQDSSKGIVDQFANLKFGQPSLLQLDNNEILATHWHCENGMYKIKIHHLKLTPAS